MKNRWLGRAIVTIALMLTFVAPSFAVNPNEVLADPALELRARVISAELRCLVCQNQSIDNSDAELAKDLRLLVREHLKAGETDAQIYDFLVARYGEFVLLKPRLQERTLLLWFAPLFLLVLGAMMLFFQFKKTNTSNGLPELSDSEKERIAKLVSDQ
jgi:cytochrome c-type biogenesis protein CcmH